MRWLLLDEILEIKKGQYARSLSHVPQTDEVSSEVLLIEMMAQTGGVLLGAENNFKDNVVFAKIEHCYFPFKGNPGDVITISATSDSLRPEGSWIEAKAESSSGVLAQARLMLVCAGTLVPETTESITFHENFLNHFKVMEKIQ